MLKNHVMDIKRLQAILDQTILDTLKVIFFSKRVNKYQGDGFLNVGARTATIKLAMAGT